MVWPPEKWSERKMVHGFGKMVHFFPENWLFLPGKWSIFDTGKIVLGSGKLSISTGKWSILDRKMDHFIPENGPFSYDQCGKMLYGRYGVHTSSHAASTRECWRAYSGRSTWDDSQASQVPKNWCFGVGSPGWNWAAKIPDLRFLKPGYFSSGGAYRF